MLENMNEFISYMYPLAVMATGKSPIIIAGTIERGMFNIRGMGLDTVIGSYIGRLSGICAGYIYSYNQLYRWGYKPTYDWGYNYHREYINKYCHFTQKYIEDHRSQGWNFRSSFERPRMFWETTHSLKWLPHYIRFSPADWAKLHQTALWKWGLPANRSCNSSRRIKIWIDRLVSW